MVAVGAPIRFAPLALPEFPGSLFRADDHGQGEAVLAEVQALCATVESRRASLLASARKALADARFLKKLGVNADLAQPIGELSASLPDLSQGVDSMARALAGLRTRSQDRGGAASQTVLGAAALIEAAMTGLREDAANILRDLISEQAIPPAPSEDAPLSRALEAYGCALGELLPSGMIESFEPEITQIAGEIVPALRVQLRSPVPHEALIALEQDAHARVAADDPSLVGLFAIDYVRPASAT